MILNKVKYGALVAVALTILRQLLPDVMIPEGLEDAIVLVIVFASQFFVKENAMTLSRLTVKD